ncbi:hypothetical protein Trydic_g8150 [Trypoxylus dichotomus]
MDTSEKNTYPLSGKHDFSTKLVCIDYPGIVNNVEKMVETLGGMTEIEKNISIKRKMLNLKFRPEDKYSKPACSDLDKKPGILVKLIPKESNVAGEQEYDYEVVGITALTYSFNKLCDFQYLPLTTKEEENAESSLTYIYDQIIPKKVPEGKEWLFGTELDDMPFFLLPAIFSRFDNPSNHLYFNRSKFYEGRFKPEYAEMLRQQELERKNSYSIDQKIISKKSGHGGLFCSFYDANVPSAPPKLALQFLNLRYTSAGACDKIKALFDKRPIWSRAAILYFSEVPKEQLKFILPAVAFHFHNGPWRIMWCKYGYDPRKDPLSRIYQTFDFRIRAVAGLKAKVRTKRQYHLQRYQSKVSANIPKVSLNEVVENAINDNNIVSESAFMLKPGIMPPARQTCYQYCDVHLPEIQIMLNRLPPVMPGTVCDYKNGWLPNKFTEQCREIVNKYMIEHIKKINQENKRLMEEQGENDSVSALASNADEEKDQDLLEISDSDNSSDSDYLPSDLSDNEDDYDEVPRPSASKKQFKKKAGGSGENDAEEDDDEIDLEAVEDVNKLLQDNYVALKEFDRLVYDSD